MLFSDYEIFRKLDKDEREIEKYILSKTMIFLTYNSSCEAYKELIQYNNIIGCEHTIRWEEGNSEEKFLDLTNKEILQFDHSERNFIKEINYNLNFSFKNYLEKETDGKDYKNKLKFINNLIKDIKHILPDNINELNDCVFGKDKYDIEYQLILLPQLLESAREEISIDLKKMLVPPADLLRFLKLELEYLKELKNLGITEENEKKEEQAETKLESEDKTIVNEWLKNENGSVIWLNSQDELTKTLFVMLDDENIKNIITGNCHKFTNKLLFNAISKLNIKISKNDNIKDINKKSFLSSYGRSKSDFNNSTKKGGKQYKKEYYKAAADELAKLIKQKCSF